MSLQLNYLIIISHYSTVYACPHQNGIGASLVAQFWPWWPLALPCCPAKFLSTVGHLALPFSVILSPVCGIIFRADKWHNIWMKAQETSCLVLVTVGILKCGIEPVKGKMIFHCNLDKWKEWYCQLAIGPNFVYHITVLTSSSGTGHFQALQIKQSKLG